jgi:hypothetical protein
MVSGESSISEGRDIGRLQRVVQFDDAPRGGLEVLGVATVGVDAFQNKMLVSPSSAKLFKTRHTWKF